jgi:hypothetical protein
MFYLRTIKTLYNLGAAAVKLTTAYGLASKAIKLVPADKRKQLIAGFSELADKSQENVLKLLEAHAPGFVDKLVERNRGGQLTKDDLADAMAQILAQQEKPAAAPEKKAKASGDAKKPKAPRKRATESGKRVPA